MEASQRTPFVIEGLPDSPVTGLLVENVTVRKYGKRGWDCVHYGGCSWEGGGCALGVVRRVEPPPPPDCVRLHLPAPPQQHSSNETAAAVLRRRST